MIIKDEIHGNIEVNDNERAVIDHPDFQRLRRIKQMAFTYLVYPGAMHTRFEHSIGVMHLSSVLCERLGFDKDTTELVRMFALIHDIGHLPFSHESEKVLKQYIGNHEQIGRKKILEGTLKDILDENLGAKKVLEMEKTLHGRAVTSDLGVDRMDYLVRDARNTGVAYGMIDIERIIHTLEMKKNDIVLREGGLEAAESLLIARFMMFSTVYLHKTVRISAALFHRALDKAISADELDPKLMQDIADDELMALLASYPSSKKYAEMLMQRKLYKEAYTLDSEAFSHLSTGIKDLEQEISEKAGCEVIMEYPTGFFKPVEFKVHLDNGEISTISEISDLIRALKLSEDRRRKLLVLCPESHREKVKKISEKVFGN
jgi:HD superfamily phosphohydrolase